MWPPIAPTGQTRRCLPALCAARCDFAVLRIRIDYVKVHAQNRPWPRFSDSYAPPRLSAVRSDRISTRRRTASCTPLTTWKLGPVDVTWSFQVFHAARGQQRGFRWQGKRASGLFYARFPRNPNRNFDVLGNSRQPGTRTTRMVSTCWQVLPRGYDSHLMCSNGRK